MCSTNSTEYKEGWRVVHLMQMGSKPRCYHDVIPMDVCHVLLGRPWQFDKKVVHEGRRKCYSFDKDGMRHVLLPLQEGSTVEQQETKF